jgi:GSCFA family
VLRNLDVEENVRYLDAFVTLARTLQPNLRVLLTVSPVPLIATATDDHVIAATTYAKSVLVAAARELRRRYAFVDYFAAYELVVNPAMPQPAFEADGRSLRADAFERVMRSFYRHYSGGAPPARVANAHQAAARQTPDGSAGAAQARIDAFEPCDEATMLAKLTADPTA